MTNGNEYMTDYDVLCAVYEVFPYIFNKACAILDAYAIEYSKQDVCHWYYLEEKWRGFPDDVKQELYDVAVNRKYWRKHSELYCEFYEKNGWAR